MTPHHTTSELVRIVAASGAFDADWYIQTYPDVVLSGLDPIEHFVRVGAWLGRAPHADFDSAAYLRAHPEAGTADYGAFLHSLIGGEADHTPAAPVGDPVPYLVLDLDPAYYIALNPDLAETGMDPRTHFDLYGYKELRNPCAAFDICWYTQTYLLGTPAQDDNALAHYNVQGAAQGYLPRPPVPISFDKTFSKPLPQDAKRICLFAAYDADGIVDETVLTYLQDLAQHADVFYLSDGPMPAAELAKLDGLVQGAWAKRHGMYDFGSYSILARDLVGWDKIATYDEMILANDSCYLVHPLAQTFETMSARGCAWWGLQATKGMISTAHQNFIPEDEPLTIEQVKQHHLNAFEEDAVYDFHVGSYFLVLRRDVINDPQFRLLLDNVEVETDKRAIIRKYEIGVTRFLISRGYEFDTLVPLVTKQHPIFTNRAFDLIDAGFPLLKRYFLTQNHHKAKGLAQWKRRIQVANPEADVSAIEASVHRSGDALRLYDNMRITSDPALHPAPRSFERMGDEDEITPKYDNWWAFPVCAYNHLFSDNGRAVFERVKDDPKIKKIVLTRSKHIAVSGKNVVVYPLDSHEGQSYLLRARQIFVRHGARSNVGYPLSSKLHNFHNLWHGIPLKRIGYASLDRADQLADTAQENARLKSVIASSDVDRLAMTAAYHPLSFHDIWVTGLPRHDWIMAEDAELPAHFTAQAQRLQAALKGRRFVLFAPTFRADQETGYYRFSETERQTLSEFLDRNGLVMGIREHMADTARLYSSQLQGDCFFDASERQYADIELLYRHADMLVTDYSSCFIDFMLTGRPMASFAFDSDSYRETQRGLFYDQGMVFPGPVRRDFPELMTGLEQMLRPPTAEAKAAYEWKTKFFHSFRDAGNADRVIQRVKDGYEGSKLLWPQSSLLSRKTPKSITFVLARTQSAHVRLRASHIAANLQALGWTCRVVTTEALTAAHLEAAEVMFVCQLPLDDRLRDQCETFAMTGGKIVYDACTLLHDQHAFDQTDAARRQPDLASDFMITSERTRQMVERADMVTARSTEIANSLEPMAMRVFEVLDDPADPATAHALSDALINMLGEKI